MLKFAHFGAEELEQGAEGSNSQHAGNDSAALLLIRVPVTLLDGLKDVGGLVQSMIDLIQLFHNLRFGPCIAAAPRTVGLINSYIEMLSIECVFTSLLRCFYPGSAPV